ncbi:MAG: 4-hydroxy-tetrahydrodipicolinate synthase [Caulobacterales bacterium]
MFSGSIPALITPLRNGIVDERAFQDLVEWQVKEGSSALVPCGTTGESPTLSHDEHRLVVRLCVEAAAGRVPVIAGAGSNSTDEAIDLTRFAKEAGAAAVLSVTPYYNKPSQAGMIAHFQAIAESADIPVIVYNIPGRSIVDMNSATMAALAKIPNIAGVKDATGDMDRVPELARLCGPDFVLLSGDDTSALGFNAMGGRGCISVTANVAPRLNAQMHAACLANDYDKAREINDRLARLHAALFIEPSPGGVKYAGSLLGLCTEEVRLPILPVTEPTKAIIREAMADAGLLN